jgi:hypothetical protein
MKMRVLKVSFEFRTEIRWITCDSAKVIYYNIINGRVLTKYIGGVESG